MTTFQIISILPVIILYSVLSYRAYKATNYMEDVWVAMWVFFTVILSILLPTIAFK